MASTPEGRIKRKVSEYLKSIDNLWYFMPVQAGYGQATLDYIGCHNGRFFAIETKAPGKKPTDRQRTTIAAISGAGGPTFVIDDTDFPHLRLWINAP